MEEHRSSPHEEDERIGAYRILRLLGRGGMGEVFLARDDRLKRQVAIKRIRRDGGLHPNLRRRLLREARAAASLNHPAIVQIYDLIDDPSGDCLVLEYAEGKTLAAMVAGGPFELGLALRLAREVAEALAAAHAAGIVHRDLKSENVIVTPSQHSKVLDFGLARMQAKPTDEVVLTEHGVVLGTYHAMSPEQARGDEADERSDLFSLGILLYEMLTGRSPFRGANPLESLRRVISEDPPRIDAARPEVPARLAFLVERLLAKDSAARPQHAADVAHELAGIEAALASAASTVASGESVSDLPTGAFPLEQGDLQQPLPRPSAAPASTAGMSVLPRRRFVQAAVLGVLILALVGAAAFVLKRPSAELPRDEPRRPLRVVVPRPEVAGNDERLGLAASAVLHASLSSLRSLEGVAPIDPLQLVGAPTTVRAIAREAAADEVLAATLDVDKAIGRVTLRRVEGASGEVIWSDSFDAFVETRDLRQLADAVSRHLRRGYSDRRLRPGALVLEARDEDYTAFLNVEQRLDSGTVRPQTELPRIESIIASSPRFLDARLLATDICLSRFRSTRDLAYLQRSLALVRQAEQIAPADPRLLQYRFNVELAGEPIETVKATLARIEGLLPADPQLPVLRASLAEREGRWDEALDARRTAAKRVPSWRNLLWLANTEAKTGHVAEARIHLGRILNDSPGNIWALENSAILELLFGDLQRAEKIYQDLIRRTKIPQRFYFTNLGLIRVLLHKYDDAVTAFRRALEIDPGHVNAILNLAEAELALGRKREAEDHYRQVLEQLRRNRPSGGPGSEDIMKEAQCLAQLGPQREAVELTQKALRQSPDDAEVLEAAAHVYAVVGDRASALWSVHEALTKGVNPRWFEVPTFASLRADPEFRNLLHPAPGTSALR